MKTTREYTVGDELAPRRAIQDIRDYLENEDSFNKMVALAKGGADYEEISFWWSFAGVDGYPVRAFYAKYSSNADAKDVVI